MANKLPWFTHDHDAHEDGWIRNLVRKQGHVAGWVWWTLIEIHHKHGVGDVLKRDINDVAKSCLTSASVITRVLTEMGTEYEGQTKVRWALVGTELQLEIKKIRERQSKLKSKIPATFRQPSVNLPIEGEREEERERQTTDSLESAGLQAAATPAEPALMMFPTVGQGPKEWPLVASKVAEWSLAYPGVDVIAEARKARQWCLDKPSKRKTYKGITSFLGKWMGRQQDGGARQITKPIAAPVRIQPLTVQQMVEARK